MRGYNIAAVTGFECKTEALSMHSVCIGKMEVWQVQCVGFHGR